MSGREPSARPFPPRMPPRSDGYFAPGSVGGGGVEGVSLVGAKVVCGREVVRVLPGERSVLCQGFSGEGLVVLKPLPRDCLVRPGASNPLAVSRDRVLHAHVRERLLRVRELADVNVANLCGVEEDEALGPMLIWQWVEGTDLSAAKMGEGGVMRLARDLVGAVEKLHLLGIVHGRLHLRNVIVRAEEGQGSGQELVLTHVSALVVDDPNRDVADLLRMLRELNARPQLLAGKGSGRGGENATLSRLLAELGTTPRLEVLRESVLLAGGTRYVSATLPSVPRASRSRVWAVVLIVVGLVGAMVLMGLTWGGGGGAGGLSVEIPAERGVR